MASKSKDAGVRSGHDGEVGYGQPPKQHQFRKGEPSRNPYGRGGKRKAEPPTPVGEPDFLDERVPIVIDGKRRQVTREEFIDHVLFKEAAKGNVRAIRELSDRRTLREKRQATAERGLAGSADIPVTADDEAIIANSFRRRAAEDGGEAHEAGEQEAGDD